MKFKLFLATLALLATSSVQANSISTTVNIFEPNDEVQYINFNVTNSGYFSIYAEETPSNSGPDPFILLFRNPLSQATFIEGANDDDFIGGNNAEIDRNLNIGSYVLAVSTNELTVQEAISGFNPAVTGKTDGKILVTISSFDGTAQFGNPSAVPVPAAAWLFGSALLGFAGFRRKSV